jgi:hypothetical protein
MLVLCGKLTKLAGIYVLEAKEKGYLLKEEGRKSHEKEICFYHCHYAYFSIRDCDSRDDSTATGGQFLTRDEIAETY